MKVRAKFLVNASSVVSGSSAHCKPMFNVLNTGRLPMCFQVFSMCYSTTVSKSAHATRVWTVQHFVDCVKRAAPEMKLKVHLLLHLPENMLDLGPTVNYST